MTIAKQIDPSPPAPSRQDPANFDIKGDAMLAFLETRLVPQINAISTQLNGQADAAIASGVSAAQSAAVAAQSRADAATSAAGAVTAAATATSGANTATAKAAEALASAASASAVTGIPVVTGKARFSLRVNAAGTAMEWVQDGNALGFAPVQQGGGVGQLANKVFIGWSGGGLKGTVDNTDLGYIPFSSTSWSSGTLTFGYNMAAAAFIGAHAGNGSGLTGLTASQIISALGFTPQDRGVFNPGGLIEVGRYFDFHAINNANDFDARLECIPPTGGSGTGGLAVTGDLRTTGNFYASALVGNGANITGLTNPQIQSALGYTPANIFAPAFTNGASMMSEPTDMNGAQNAALTVVQNSGNPNHSAHMQFLRAGFYGIKMGLDATNTFAIGGWSQGAYVYRMSCDASGNLAAMGNLTAYSDIKFKTELEPMLDVVPRLLQVEHGGMRYLDTRTGQHKYGVSAQAVRKLFPDAVVADEKGFLSVAYGQLALAALIEVTREFQVRLDAQQFQINQLMKAINGNPTHG